MICLAVCQFSAGIFHVKLSKIPSLQK